MDELYIYNITTSGSGFRNIIVKEKPSWLSITSSDIRGGTLTLEGTPTEGDAGPGTYGIRLRLDDNTNSLIYPEQTFTITIPKLSP